MKVLIKLAIGLVLILVLGAGGIGLFGSGEYQVAKAITIESSPDKIHPYLSDLKRWPEWAPWQKHDETIETTYGPKTEGVGASQKWTSAEDGDGDLTLTKSDPASGIAYDMAFIMEGTRLPATSAMSYKTVDSGTEVSWTMNGNLGDGFTEKIMAFMMPMMVGPMFGEGLSDLKSKVEASK